MPTRHDPVPGLSTVATTPLVIIATEYRVLVATTMPV